MAQITNINASPVISPDGTYLVGLKEGHFCRIDGAKLAKDSEIQTICQEMTKDCFKAIEKLQNEITILKNTVNQIEGMLSMVLNGIAENSKQNEEMESSENTKAKSKKSKK